MNHSSTAGNLLGQYPSIIDGVSTSLKYVPLHLLAQAGAETTSLSTIHGCPPGATGDVRSPRDPMLIVITGGLLVLAFIVGGVVGYLLRGSQTNR